MLDKRINLKFLNPWLIDFKINSLETHHRAESKEQENADHQNLYNRCEVPKLLSFLVNYTRIDRMGSPMNIYSERNLKKCLKKISENVFDQKLGIFN